MLYTGEYVIHYYFQDTIDVDDEIKGKTLMVLRSLETQWLHVVVECVIHRLMIIIIVN